MPAEVDPPDAARHRRTGWVLVGVQVVLLLALIALPGSDHWGRPPWLLAVASLLTFGGMIVVVVAIVQLGRSITPSPEPLAGGALRTDGLYRWVRHPIYSGVLLLVIGVALRSGNVLTVILAVVIVGFFVAKSRWEEQRLRAHYPGYDAYAARTPGLVPAPWRH